MNDNELNIIAVIPARLASSRFPDKPMAKIHGMPMIGHCYHRAKMAGLLADVYVATCDEEIFDYIEGIGGKAVMTADTHLRCTDRAAEAVQKIEASTSKKIDVILIIQGDEPMLVPEMLDASITPMLSDPRIRVVNLYAQMQDRKEHEDPNEVKVVIDCHSNALYFSREAIPSWRKGGEGFAMLKQVCIIPFRRDFLFEYMAMEPTMLEVVESVDMNRILEHGYDVKMVPTDVNTYAVDTPEDLAKVEELMKEDSFMQRYI